MTKTILLAAALFLSACGIVDPNRTYDIPRAVTVPTLGGGNQQFVQIASGFFHVCALDVSGQAWCWGDNQYKQSGRSEAGSRCDQTSTCILRPALVETSLRFKAVSAGVTHSCGITQDGSAYCWGGGYENGRGILGNGQLTTSASPVRVAGSVVFKSISVGGRVTCGVATDQSAYCWGTAGTIGDGQRLDALAPALVRGNHHFASISAGSSHVCALDTDAIAWCWGSNQYGQIGDGRITAIGIGTGSGPTSPTRVASDRLFRTLSAGSGHTCGTSVEGENLCWGDNGLGQLGIGEPSAPQPLPVQVKDGAGLTGIVASVVHTCALAPDGGSMCWGGNWFGALGDGTSTAENTGSERPVPTPARTSTRFTQIAPGGSHTCALAKDGRVLCWGDKGRGQIGHGSSWN